MNEVSTLKLPVRHSFERQEVLLTGVYLVTVGLTVGISGAYGPLASVIDSAPGIGLVIAIRNRLQDYWWPHKMFLLFPVILLGAVGATVTNLGRLQVAAGSFEAFLAANIAATIVYRRGGPSRFVVSLIVFAVVDSFVFPTVAFGHFHWWVMGGQVGAKILGGLVWSWVFSRYITTLKA